METVKAAVFLGQGKPLEVQEFPMPEVVPGAVLIKMEMAAICATDVHASHHATTPYPLIFGHENIGVLAKAGRGIDKDVLGVPLREGDRVLFRAAPCGRCYGCALNENCTATGQYGFRPFKEPPHITGGFSQYVYLDAANPWLLRVPDSMATERALMSVIGNHTVWRGIQKIGGITLADTVVVQGAGPIGMGALVQSKIAAAQLVIVIGAPVSRLDLARDMGADVTVDLADHSTPEARVSKVLELTGGRGADVVIECSGANSAVQEGFEMTRAGGRYLVVGQLTDYGAHPINPSLITRKGLRIAGVTGASPEPIIRAMQALEHVIPYPVEKLVTHHFPLDRVNDGFRVHESWEAMVAVVTPNR